MSAANTDTSETGPVKSTKGRRRLRRWLVRLVLFPFIALSFLFLLVYLPPVQQVIKQRALAILNERTGARIELARLRISFPLNVRLEGLFVADEQQDTLLYAGVITTKAGLVPLLNGELRLERNSLSDVYARLEQRADSSFNFDFIVHAFAGQPDAPAKDTASGGFTFSMGDVALERFRYTMIMRPADLEMDVALGELTLAMSAFDLEQMRFHADAMALRQARVALRVPQGTQEPPSYPALSNPLAGLDLAFKQVLLEGSQFALINKDTGDSLWIELADARFTSHEMDTRSQRVHLAEVVLDGFTMGTLTKGPATVADSMAAPPWLDQHDGFRYWTQDWDLAIQRFEVSRSNIAFHTGDIASPRQFVDPEHLVFSSLGLGIRELILNNDRVAFQLDSLAIHAGPEHGRVELRAHVEATPERLAVDNGLLGVMKNNVFFHAEVRPHDLSTAYRKPEDVPCTVELRSDLRLADVVPLLHQLGMELPNGSATGETWHTKAWAEGSLREVEEAGIQLSGDQGTEVHARAGIRNAMQWPGSSYTLSVEQLTMGSGLREVVAALAPPTAPIPTRFTLSGRAQGIGYDGVVELDMRSNLGDLRGKAKAHGWKGSTPGHLELDIRAEQIAAARLTGDTALGPVSFRLVAHANGLNDPSRQGSAELEFTRLSYHGSDLSSLCLTAEAIKDSLHMGLTCDADPASLEMRSASRWPQEGDSLAVQLDLTLARLGLQELGITPQELNAESRVTGRIAWLPGAGGSASLDAQGLRLYNNASSFPFEHFALSALVDSSAAALDLDCDAARIGFRTNMSLDSTFALLHDRLLGAFQEPYAFKPPPGKEITLKIDLPATNRLAGMILPDLRAIEVERLEGHYNSDKDALALEVDIPTIDHSGVEVRALTLNLKAIGADLDGEMTVARIMRDSLYVDGLVLSATNAPGALRTLFRLRTEDSDRYRIGMDMKQVKGIPVLQLQEDILLDRVAWRAKAGNALHMDPKGMQAEDFVLTSGDQRIEIRTEADGNHLDISNFDLSGLTGLVRSQDSLALLRGSLDATVLLPLRKSDRLAAEMALHQLHVMGVDLGTVTAHLQEVSPDHFKAELQLDAGMNRLEAGVNVDLSEADMRSEAQGHLDLQELAVFAPLLTDHLFELAGALRGDLHYEQHGDQMSVIGNTVLQNARFGLVKTGSVYRIPQDSIVFDQQGLSLRDFTVLDAKENRFKLDGRVNTKEGEAPILDLRLRTDRFQLVNSTIKDNPLFFGKLYSGIDLQIEGTASAPIVKGEVGILDSTALSVVLPGSKVEMVEHTGIVQFTADLNALDTVVTKTDSELLRDSLAAQLPGIDLDLQIKIDRNTRFAIVLDPTTGDEATFSGSGDLHFRYDPAGELHLEGPFTLADGGYTLEFYGLVKKRFELVPGSKIVWSGDPLAGRMDLQAKYSTRAAPFPLVANARGGLTESERNALQAPLPFDVLIHIRGIVNAPDISFGLEMDRQARSSAPQVSSVLDQLSKPGNQEELNRQVFGLLVLSTFIEDEIGAGQGGSNLASTAARNSVNGILTQQLNRLTGQGIKGMNVQLGVSTFDQTEGGESYSRTTLDYKVTQRVMNDRISIEAGGSVGYNERRQEVSAMSNTRAPQYAIAYDITRDGRLRLRVYHENAFDMYDGELVNNGVAIMLTRDFEKNARELEQLRKAILQTRDAQRDQEQER